MNSKFDRIAPVVVSVLARGLTFTEAATRLGMKEGKLGYWVKRLIEGSYVQKRPRGGGYEILQPGLDLMRKMAEPARPAIGKRIEGLAWMYPVLEGPTRNVEKMRPVPEMKNWKRLIGEPMILGVGWELHEGKRKVVQINTGVLRGKTEDDMVGFAKTACDERARLVERELGVRLDIQNAHPKKRGGTGREHGEFVPEVKFQVLAEIVEANGRVDTPTFTLDGSPGKDDKGKIECKTAELAEEIVQAIRDTPALMRRLVESNHEVILSNRAVADVLIESNKEVGAKLDAVIAGISGVQENVGKVPEALTRLTRLFHLSDDEQAAGKRVPDADNRMWG